MTRRGRPPLPPEQRKPRVSGPSGKHRVIEGRALMAQRRAMIADMGAELASMIEPVDLLPIGIASRVAAALGLTQRHAADLVGKLWRGKRRYRARARMD